MLARPDSFRLNPFSPLAQGLVFAGLGWRGSDKTTHYHDSSLYGNNGTLTNMAPASDWVWVSELGRWALDFDGTDDIISLSLSMSLSAFTFAVWANCTASSGRNALLGDVSTYTNSWYLYPSAGQCYTYFDDGTGKNVDFGNTADVQGWHLWSFRYDGTNIIFGRDNSFLSPTTSSGEHIVFGTADADNIGTMKVSGVSEYFQGQISDYLIFNRCLFDVEIQSLADPSNTMLSGLILPDRLKFWPAVVTGGAPAFNPAWARRCNNLIGGGIA
jgi:hypothetical protein